jgi:nitrate reductase gamma subunit
MTSFDALLFGLLLAVALWAKLALWVIWFRTKSFGKRILFAKAAGSTMGGAAYAFTVGLLPWTKESVRENLPSYAMGIAFHLGLLTSFVMLAAHILQAVCPACEVPSFFQITIITTVIPVILMAIGVVSGVSLFVKRLINPVLRGISCPDDYISNFLVTSAIALALLQALMPSDWVSRLWVVSAIVLFAFIPLGKIRHCLFFFSTRYHLGAFFGRRGCMPPSKTNSQKHGEHEKA